MRRRVAAVLAIALLATVTACSGDDPASVPLAPTEPPPEDRDGHRLGHRTRFRPSRTFPTRSRRPMLRSSRQPARGTTTLSSRSSTPRPSCRTRDSGRIRLPTGAAWERRRSRRWRRSWPCPTRCGRRTRGRSTSGPGSLPTPIPRRCPRPSRTRSGAILGERGLERAFNAETGYVAPRLGILADGTWFFFVQNPAP